MSGIGKPKSDLSLSLKNILKRESLPNVIGILGSDRVRRERVIQYMLEEKPESQRKINRFKAEDLSLVKLKSFFEQTASLSLFEKQTINIIDNAQAFNAELGKVIRDSISTASLSNVIILSGTKLLSALLQTVKQYEALVELPELKGVELRKWVAREYKRVGLDIESDKVVEATLELSNDSLDKAAAIVEHVSLFCDSQIVTTGTLSALFKGRFTGNEYALFHSAIKKDRPQTLGNLKDIQRGGMNAFPLLGLIFRNLSTTSSIAELKRKNFPDSQIQKILNLPPWLFTKHKESSLIYPLSNLTSHFRAVLRADSKLKNYSLGDESVIAEVLECFMAK